jgi:hypothetical protein
MVVPKVSFSAFEGVQIFCPRFNVSELWVRVPSAVILTDLTRLQP